MALGQRRRDVLGLWFRPHRSAQCHDKRALWTKGRMMPRNASHARMAITLSSMPGSGRRWPRPPASGAYSRTSRVAPHGITSNYQLFTVEVVPPG